MSLLAGCGLSAKEEIYNHLEKAVSLESVFEQQQQPLVELETKEQELYEKIIGLGMSQFEEIKVLSQQALEIVNERKSRIDKEKESINASRQEFLLIEPKVESLKDEKIKEDAKILINTMNERYQTYDKLYNYYQDAIALDQKLYEMFQNKELTLQQLEDQVKKINEMYEKVMKANQKFNELTDTYNVKKKEFYQAAELEVVFESDEITK